jgi:hypothetical protein
MISSSFICSASVSRFCVFCIRNTIKKVIIVVPVFITSCHVSLKPKSGPVNAHVMISVTAQIKVTGLPVTLEANRAKRVKKETFVMTLASLRQ